MIYKIIAILILALFYSFYFAKILIQKGQSIRTNQMGIGNKPKKVLLIERIISVATVLTAFVGIGSIFLVKKVPVTELRIAGIVIGVIAIVSISLMFFNIPLVVVSIWAAVMLHLQILQEEEHMHRMFGVGYDEYRKHTGRYLGKKC